MAERVLTSRLQQARGVIGRYPAPDERYVFEFDRVAPRLIHMLGVRRPLRVRWFAEGEPTADVVLRPWTGHGRNDADEIWEEAA